MVDHALGWQRVAIGPDTTGDTASPMTEKSAKPGLVERTRDLLASAIRGDADAFASFYAPDAVWDNSRHGLEVVEGLAAIRRLNEDWLAAHEGWELEPGDSRPRHRGGVCGV
jgi:hypothetical protein